MSQKVILFFIIFSVCSVSSGSDDLTYVDSTLCSDLFDKDSETCECYPDVKINNDAGVNGLSHEQVVFVGKFANAIFSYQKNEKIWSRCGKTIVAGEDDKLMMEWSVEWAYHIVRHSYEFSDNDLFIDPMYVAALCLHESHMDECSIGPHVRKAAYKRKLLSKPSRALTFKREDVLNAVTKMEKRFSSTGVDIGPCQILSKYYSEQNSYDKMMTADWGVMECVRELNRRGHRWNTSRPWKLWRGYSSDEYDNRIERKRNRLKRYFK